MAKQFGDFAVRHVAPNSNNAPKDDAHLLFLLPTNKGATMPAQISQMTSFFLEEDDEIQIRIEQLNEDTWTVDIGEVRHDYFYPFVTFFAKSEKQAQNLRKVWKEKVAA